MTKQDIQKQINLIVAMRGNYYFKINEVIFNIFKEVKLNGLDWTIINELHQALKGTDKKLLQGYITQYTPLNFSTEKGFTKPKKAKWDDLNLITLRNNSMQDFVKIKKEQVIETPVLDEAGNKTFDANGDLIVSTEVVDTKKYDLSKKGSSIIKYADKVLKDFDASGITNEYLRYKLVEFKVQAQMLADDMEIAKNSPSIS